MFKLTLCWECKYSALGDKSPCEWAREFKPVVFIIEVRVKND